MRYPSAILVLSLAACKKDAVVPEDEFHEPTLVLEDPAPAAWSAEGTAQVSGQAEFLTDVTVAGQSVEAADGRFSGEIQLRRGINLVEAAGVDERGDVRFVRNGVLAGHFADPGAPVENAGQIRVNQGGIDAIAAAATTLIDPAAIRDVMLASNPVYEDSYGIWGFDAVTIRADIVDVQFKNPQIAVTPSAGVLDITVTIPDVMVQVYASGDVVGFDFGSDVWVWADAAVITGQATVGAEDGRIALHLPAAEVTLEGFGYDTSLLPGDVESYLLVETIQTYIQDTLSEQIIALVPPLLEEQLAALQLSFDTTILEKQVHIEGEVASAGVDPDGIVAELDLDVKIPSQGEKTYVGFLAAPAGLPDADRAADLGVSLSDDLLNRVLFEAWRSGMLDMRLSTDDGSLDPFLLSQLHATEGTIQLNSRLPPVIVPHEGKLQAQLGELDVRIETPGGGLGNWLDASATVYVALDVKVENSEIKLKLGEPTVAVTVRGSDWGASNESTTTLLEDMLPVDAMLLLLGNFKFPIPAIGGLAVGTAEVGRDASGAYATGMAVDLVEAE